MNIEGTQWNRKRRISIFYVWVLVEGTDEEVVASGHFSVIRTGQLDIRLDNANTCIAQP